MSVIPVRSSTPGIGGAITPSSGGGNAGDFQQLLRDSLSLISHIDSGGIPAIQRNIAQLDVASRKLASQHSKHEHNDAQA